LSVGILVSCVFLVAGLTLTHTNGIPGRVSAQVLRVANAGSELDRPAEQCTDSSSTQQVRDEYPCRIGDPSGVPRLLLWGDSHAAALTSALSIDAAGRGVAAITATRTACPPIVGGRVTLANDVHDYCAKHNAATLAKLERTPSITTVVLAARWSVYVQGHGEGEYDAVLGTDPYLRDAMAGERAVIARERLLELGLRELIDQVHGLKRRVFLIDPIPENEMDVPSALARKMYFRMGGGLTIPLDRFLRRNGTILTVFDRLAQERSVARISPSSVLCSSGHCDVHQGVKVFYADDDHLSRTGAAHVMVAFAPVFQ
jgi:hypothetical protein